jgi:hypothetical protein
LGLIRGDSPGTEKRKSEKFEVDSQMEIKFVKIGHGIGNIPWFNGHLIRSDERKVNELARTSLIEGGAEDPRRGSVACECQVLDLITIRFNIRYFLECIEADKELTHRMLIQCEAVSPREEAR